MDRVHVGLSPDQRKRLAEKGRILYVKSCGTTGKGTCAESFALHHIWRGEAEIARDLLAFLETEATALRAFDPDSRLTFTEELAARIRADLDLEAEEPPDSARRASILKMRKQQV